MRIAEVMTHCPYNVPAETLPGEALEKMKLWGIRHLPVISGADLLGVVTERDVQLTVLAGEISGYRPTMGDVCRKDPYVVHVEDQVSEVVYNMAEQKLDYALVADAEERLVGIFTSTDACRLLYRLLGREKI